MEKKDLMGMLSCSNINEMSSMRSASVLCSSRILSSTLGATETRTSRFSTTNKDKNENHPSVQYTVRRRTGNGTAACFAFVVLSRALYEIV